MFSTRVATAAVLLAACVSALLLLPNAWWAALTFPALVAAAWEWSALARYRGAVLRWLFAGLVSVSAAALWLAIATADLLERSVYLAAGAFWVAGVPLWLGLRWSARSPVALGAVGWIVLVPAWLALVSLQADPGRLLSLLAVLWVSDTAAYLAGRAWGRRKLAPAISPGKTWEGVAGAAVAVAVYYAILSATAPAVAAWPGAAGAVLFAAVAVMGVVGDLFESWIKRQAGVKDSGSLLPGHGGVLDRIDSLTAALPFAALLLPWALAPS